MWAQGGRQERSKWLLGAARGAPKNVGWAPVPPRGEKLIDFRVPGRSLEGSRGGSGEDFLEFFRPRAVGATKTLEHMKHVFS